MNDDNKSEEEGRQCAFGRLCRGILARTIYALKAFLTSLAILGTVTCYQHQIGFISIAASYQIYS